MIKVCDFTIPVQTKNWSNNSQGMTRGAMFARAAAKQHQRELTRLVLSPARQRLQSLLGQHGMLIVVLTRLAPSNGLDPDDNLRTALKWVKDGVAKVIGLDDRDRRIKWLYDQRREKDYGVFVEIGIPGPDCPVARR